jgi:integrase/recombinase XerD
MQEMNRRRFELLIEKFVEHMRVLGWSPRTIDSYRSQLRFLIDYLDRETDVEEISGISPEVLHGYQTHLYTWTDDKGRGLSIATQATRLCAVRSFCRHLVKSDVLLYDPAASVEMPKRKKALPRDILTKKETARLLRTPDTTTPLGLRDRTMIEVLYGTGMRNAELRALKLNDLDLDGGMVRIIQGKNAKDRNIPLGKAACRYLKEYLIEARPKLLAGRGSEGAIEQTLFLSRTGRPLLPLGVIWQLKKHARNAGIAKQITPHSLRHTFATHLLAGRANLRSIQEMLGHASVATTQIYTRVDITDLKAVHRRCHPREKQ